MLKNIKNNADKSMKEDIDQIIPIQIIDSEPELTH